MKLMIDIHESIIEHIKDGSFGARPDDRYTLVTAVMNSTSPLKGKWTVVPIGGYMLLHQCSNCLRHSVVKSKYCPNCGIKMEVKENASDN